MMSQGWQVFRSIFLLMIAVGGSAQCMAASLTVRDIQFVGKNQIEITLDGIAPKTNLEIDYVRDIVQFSIQNATIYPAKIVHADSSANESAFTKVFAYQYAPNLVRVRFSVEGEAQNYKGKVKWVQKGKSIVVQFPEGVMAAKVSKSEPKKDLKSVNKNSKSEEKDDAIKERSLLAKVLGQNKPTEKTAEAVVENKIASKEASNTNRGSNKDTSENSEKQVVSEKKTPLHLHNNSEKATLGGQKSGPSVFRSFLAMFAIVGGLGLFLVYIKKKKNGVQAKKVGDSWFSSFLPDSMKKAKSFIEVMGTHSLGPKQSIVVIRIRGQQFVLGVTQDNVQLITQLDADEVELDLLDDPTVAASIGKMFGGKPTVAPTQTMQSIKAAQSNMQIANQNESHAPKIETGSSFNSMLRAADAKPAISSNVIIARNAYSQHASTNESTSPNQSSVRDQIKKRLEAMR